MLNSCVCQRYGASAADRLALPHVLSDGYCGRWVGCLGWSWKAHVIAPAGFKPTVSIPVLAVRRDMATVWIAVILLVGAENWGLFVKQGR